MPGYRHILFPVDFAERSKAVRPYVNLFAQQFKSKLTLLNVVQLPPGIYNGLDASFPVMFDFPTMESQVRILLDQYLDPERAGLKEVRSVVQHGDPASVITDYARQNGVDLIMMPTHGYGRFRNFLLGSVASKVLHDADCAVWTAAHTEDPDIMKHSPCRNILVAVDLGGPEGDIVCQAAELAREFGATLRLVHAVPGAVHHPLDTGGAEFSMFLLRVARDRIAELQQQNRTSFEVSIEAGTVPQVVRSTALEYRSDLVVIGRGVLHETLGRLRSKSYDIIRESPCPVLSL